MFKLYFFIPNDTISRFRHWAEGWYFYSFKINVTLSKSKSKKPYPGWRVTAQGIKLNANIWCCYLRFSDAVLLHIGWQFNNYFLNACFYTTADFNLCSSNSSFEANFVTETLQLLQIIPTIDDEFLNYVKIQLQRRGFRYFIEKNRAN